MVKNNIGAIFVKDNDNIVGIYTERDLMEETV
jgi:CBS domain-containing protein